MKSSYDSAFETVFFNNYHEGDVVVPITKEEFNRVVLDQGLKAKNLPDIIYEKRYRRPLPKKVLDKAPKGTEWVIIGTGKGLYELRLSDISVLDASKDIEETLILDATPEVVRKYAPSFDEQALLTKIRYNRIIDIALGITSFSIQNHLRTSLKGMGQIEIDEIYVGVNSIGTNFIIPCQAKSPHETFGLVQAYQDKSYCQENYSNAIPRLIGVKFLEEELIAIIETNIKIGTNGVIKWRKLQENHYRLVKSDEISDSQLIEYRDRYSFSK